ncbi:MAG: hypothetical protein DDT42_01940 [candidate division WS2 bacterium]|uniref:Uncharacterized protein n=1 Tax=Psychracetigena formicireducens TaxID=2986056 RepID=A0A9E2BJ89_PSYF1|nr:hypothetical protein [Candidatus Psychracetigena formicireducens]
MVEVYHTNGFVYEIDLLISKAFLTNTNLKIIGYIYTYHEYKIIYTKELVAPLTKDKNKVDPFAIDTLYMENDKTLCKELSILVTKEHTH